MADFDLDRALARLETAAPRRESGRVTEVTGLVVRASVPGLRVGELVTIDDRLEAEVVGFRGDEVVLMPLGEATGIGPDSLVTPTGRPLSIAVSEACSAASSTGSVARSTAAAPSPRREPGRSTAPAPDPLSRRRVTRPLPLGVRALDALLTVGRGAAGRSLRRFGRRQVDADGPDRPADRGRRQRDRASSASAAARWSTSSRSRWARPGGRDRWWSARPAMRPAWCG